jgi:hypothetical protein
MKMSGENARRPTVVRQPVIRNMAAKKPTKAQRELAKKRAYKRIPASKIGNQNYANKLIEEELANIMMN